MQSGQRRIARLRWLCRRGMKELDVLLESFLSREQSALCDGAWPGLEGLLNAEDDCLWDWVQGRTEPPQDLRALIGAIRG